MRYLIVGCGRVGSSLARYLDRDGHEVIVVDENAGAFKRLGSKFKGHVVLGTGIDYDVLKRAGAAAADGFVAVTNGDNRNIMAALIAQRMFHIKRIVARIYDPPRGEMYAELGVATVCPTTVGAKMIRDVLMAPWHPLQDFDFGKLIATSACIGVADAGRRVGELESDGRIRIGAIRRRSGEVSIASRDTVLAEGDAISALVSPDAIDDFSRRFGDAAVAEKRPA